MSIRQMANVGFSVMISMSIYHKATTPAKPGGYVELLDNGLILLGAIGLLGTLLATFLWPEKRKRKRKRK